MCFPHLIFLFLAWASYFPNQGCNLCPVQWKNGILSLDHWGTPSPMCILEEAKREFDIHCPCDSLVEAARGPRLPSHPSSCRLLSSLQVCTQTGPRLGCSGNKDVLSCFLGELHPSCTLPYSRAWVVLGKGTWNRLSPALNAEETKAPRGEEAFPSQFSCQDKTHDDSQPRVQPTRP